MSSGSTARISGLASGFDTQSIVDSLMSLERMPFQKLQTKKETEDVKLQAYQALNSQLLKFRTALNSLSSKKLWNSNATVSTNEKSITANANEYAVKGTYNFRVAQLASQTKYLTKGFSSKNSALVKDLGEPPDGGYDPIGSLSVSSAKSRVDNSAKLDTLNGGEGVFRGSVRVTDSSGNSAIVDLSACDTLDDVARSLSSSNGVQVTATVDDKGRLNIEDASNGAGSVRIQNVGAGTTASDLGIAGTSSATGVNGNALLVGGNAYTLGEEMDLSLLNDGLGVEPGNIQFDIKDDVGNTRSFFVNIDDCDTVGDVMKRVNDALDAERAKDDSSLPLKKEALEDLRLSFSADKTSLALIGTKANMTYQIGDRTGGEATQGKGSPANDLGLTGRYVMGAAATDIEFERVLGSANSPMLKSLSGVGGAGVGMSSDPTSGNGRVTLPFSGDTLLKNLNGGTGVDLSTQFQLQMKEGGIDNGVAALFNDIFSNADVEEGINNGTLTTVNDLLGFMNDKLEAYANDPAKNAAGLKGLSFSFNEEYGTVSIDGGQAGYSYEILGSVPFSVGVQQVGGSAVGLVPDDPANYPDDAAVMDEVDKFYNMKGASSLLEGNNDIDENSTLGDLLKLGGIDEATYNDPSIVLTDYTDIAGGKTAQEQYDEAQHNSWVNASKAQIDTMFAAGSTFEMAYDSDGDGTTDAAASINWDDVRTALGGTLDSSTNVNDFMDAVNSTIDAAFAGLTDANGDPVIGPKMSVNTYANGFRWSNVDMSRQWDMSDTSGTGLAAMNLDRDTSAIFAANNNQMTMQDSQLTAGPVNPPMAEGYYVMETLDGNTALDKLNFQAGINPIAGRTIDITIDGSNTISISTDDIIAGLAGITDPTMDDYLGILNSLKDAELANLNTTLGLTGADAISFDFGITSESIGLVNIENIDKIAVGGDGVTGQVVGGIPIYNVGFGPLAEFDIPDGQEEIRLGAGLNPVSLVEKEIEGIGQIAFTVGSGGDVIHLNTDGINKNSTLDELITKLNSELDRIAADPMSTASLGYSQADIDALRNMRFTLNENGTGLAVDNGMKKAVTFKDTVDAAGNPDNQFLGQELGLVGQDGSDVRVEAQTFDNMDTLNRKFISRATDLKTYLGTDHVMGSIRLTDAAGKSSTIGLDNCKTIGDVIDAINSFQGSGLGMQARINKNGDGIEIIQGWASGMRPDEDDITGVIKIEDMENGTTASKLGIAGSGKADKDTGLTTIDGSTSVRIEVMPDDTLESLMYRIAESGEYTCSIVNSGTSTNPVYRLDVSSKTTGEASDFVISCDIEALGFSQASRGKDAKVLYGDPSSNSSPILLSSDTNSNSTAILGLTLDIKSTSNEWSSITVSTDKEKVTDEVKNMVTAYNDLVNFIMALDGYDAESGEKGILFGDTNVRGMMDTINEFFYQVYNPGNLAYGEKTQDGKQGIWSWMDAGISLSSRNSNSDGSGAWFTTLELDEDALKNMVSENWDIFSKMMTSEQNIADPSRPASARPMASFNGELVGGDAGAAINGNTSKTASNGIKAVDTIANGANTYTITFQQPVAMNRMSIYHESPANSLNDFVVEYLNPDTGDWEILRKVEDNATDQNHFGFADAPMAAAIRITASSTNAEDGKFRLLDVQIYEQSGLASKLNQSVNQMSDTTGGFLASRTEEHTSTLSDLQEQMDRMQSMLTAKEEALWRKFTAMETALGKLQNQKSYLTNMLGGAKTT